MRGLIFINEPYYKEASMADPMKKEKIRQAIDEVIMNRKDEDLPTVNIRSVLHCENN